MNPYDKYGMKKKDNNPTTPPIPAMIEPAFVSKRNVGCVDTGCAGRVEIPGSLVPLPNIDEVPRVVGMLYDSGGGSCTNGIVPLDICPPSVDIFVIDGAAGVI